MNGGRHRLFAALSTPPAAGIAVGLVGPLSPEKLITAAAVAVITSTVPDLDNTKGYRKVDKAAPDEKLGGGGPLGHRQLLHWWGLPVGLGCLASFADLGDVGWIIYAALWGYLSHILLDLPFGEEGHGTRKGVPVFLWYGRIGGWFYSDKLAADLLILPVCGFCCWTAFGWPTTADLPISLTHYLH